MVMLPLGEVFEDVFWIAIPSLPGVVYVSCGQCQTVNQSECSEVGWSMQGYIHVASGQLPIVHTVEPL